MKGESEPVGLALVLQHSSNDELRWMAWANLFARAHPIAATDKLSLAHATHQITCVGALEPDNGMAVPMLRIRASPQSVLRSLDDYRPSVKFSTIEKRISG